MAVVAVPQAQTEPFRAAVVAAVVRRLQGGLEISTAAVAALGRLAVTQVEVQCGAAAAVGPELLLTTAENLSMVGMAETAMRQSQARCLAAAAAPVLATAVPVAWAPAAKSALRDIEGKPWL